MFFEVLYTDTMQKEQFEVNKGCCIVGRSPKVDVTINNEGLSRNHFQIELVDGEFYVTDLNSTNGVVVNGEKLLTGVRTAYKAIFPLEIADRISITVAAEANEVTGQHRILTKPQNTGEATTTKTKKLEIEGKSNPSIKKGTPHARPASFNKKTKPGEGQALPMPVLAASLLVIFGLVWYFLQDRSGETLENEVITSADPSLKESRQDPAVIPRFNPTEIDLTQHQSASECDKLGELCKALALTHAKEGIAVVNNHYIVYVNLEFFPLDQTSASFQKLPDREKSEFILAQVATNPALQAELETKQPSHLLVVGFTAIEEMIRFKYMLNVSYQQLPGFNEDFHKFLFSEIFQAGVTRTYKKYVGYYTQMVDL